MQIDLGLRSSLITKSKHLPLVGRLHVSVCLFFILPLLLISAEICRASPIGKGYFVVETPSGVAIGIGNPTTDPKPFQHMITIGSILVEDTFPGLEVKVGALTAPLAHHQLRVAEIFTLAQAIETLHKEAGYALARVVVPNQTLGDGSPLKIQVVDVRVSELRTGQMPDHMARYIRFEAQPLVEKSHPTSGDLATLVGASQYAFGQEVTLEAGETARNDRVALDLSGPKRSIVAEVSAMTFLSKPFQVTTLGANATVYGSLGFGERITFGGCWSREHDEPDTNGPIWLVAGGYSVPLDGGGSQFLEANGSVAKARLTTGSDYAAAYQASRASLIYTKAIFGSAEQSFLFRIGPEVISEQEKLTLQSDFGEASLSVPFTTIDARASGTWAYNAATGFKFESGLEINLGETRTWDASSSEIDLRAKAIGRVDLHTRIDMPLMNDFVLTSYANATVSFLGSLPPSLQTQLLQSTAANPIDPRTIQGDSGARLRMELSRSFNVKAGLQPVTLQPYLFAAGGVVYQTLAVFSEADRVRGEAEGLGLRFGLPNKDRDGPIMEGSVEAWWQQTTSRDVPDYAAVVLTTKLRF